LTLAFSVKKNISEQELIKIKGIAINAVHICPFLKYPFGTSADYDVANKP
jgi:hypothetical protein